MYILDLKKHLDILKLDNDKARKYTINFCLFALILLSILIRKSLIDFKNADYQIFSSWYDFIKIHGIHSFKYGADAGFSNYNPPYTYFLYIASLLPLSKAVVIK